MDGVRHAESRWEITCGQIALQQIIKQGWDFLWFFAGYQVFKYLKWISKVILSLGENQIFTRYPSAKVAIPHFVLCYSFWGPACVCFWFPCEWIPNIFSNLPIIHIRVALRVASECYININDKVHSGTEAPFYAKWGGMENLKKSSNVIIPTMTSLQHYHQKLDNIAVSLFTNRETAMLSIENIWRNSSPISSRKTCSAPSLSLRLNFQVVKIMSKVSGAAFSLSCDCQIGGGGNLETELSPRQNLKV